MHYLNLVIIEKTDDINAAVEEAMGPNEELGGFWGWYQIGGRWTGALDGYSPENDPTNIVVCNFCHGSGVRRDAVGLANGMPERNTYNGCEGKGKHAVWPSNFAKYPGDIASIESLTEEAYAKFFRVVIDGKTFGGEDYLPWREVGEMFPKRERPPLKWLKEKYKDHFVVVVDNHN